MNKLFSRKWKSIPNNQRGMALITALLFLLVLSLIGLAGMQSSLFQERMAGNFEHRSFAFQAAEAGLRQAEAWLNNTVILPAFDNTGGLYTPAAAGSSPRWETVDWLDDAQCRTFSADGLSGRYIVEYVTNIDVPTSDSAKFGPAPEDQPAMYRITSRGTSLGGVVSVLLQTMYVR